MQARNIAILNSDVLLLEEECNNSKFVKFRMDKKGFHIEKRIDGILTNYKFSYHPTEKDVGSNTIYYINKQLETEDGQLNQNDFEECRTEIEEYYDEWIQSELNKILGRSGVATAIGLSLEVEMLLMLVTNPKN